MTVTYKEYMEDKKAFFEKHNYDYTVDTSSMDEYGRYRKIYNFEDGAQWYETMSPVTVTKTIEVELVKVDVEQKLKEQSCGKFKGGMKNSGNDMEAYAAGKKAGREHMRSRQISGGSC